jgi:hypothetical protein
MCLKKLNFQAETEPRRGNTVKKLFPSLNVSLRALLMGSITALVIAGCGGSGAGNGAGPTPTPTPGTGGTAASLQLI